MKTIRNNIELANRKLLFPPGGLQSEPSALAVNDVTSDDPEIDVNLVRTFTNNDESKRFYDVLTDPGGKLPPS